MIYLLHGDNLVASRNWLKSLVDQAKSNNQEVIRLNGLGVKIEDTIQALESNSLFGGERLVVIENLFSRPKSNEQKQILDFLKNYQGKTDLILWEKKEIGKISQRNLPNQTTVKLFKTPLLLFKFLDQLTPKTKSSALQTLATLLKSESAELVFYLLVRQIRLLLLVASGQKIKGPSWMVTKLKKQADILNQDRLLTIYQKLFTIDESVKTGKTLMPLNWHLQMLIINHL